MYYTSEFDKLHLNLCLIFYDYEINRFFFFILYVIKIRQVSFLTERRANYNYTFRLMAKNSHHQIYCI